MLTRRKFIKWGARLGAFGLFALRTQSPQSFARSPWSSPLCAPGLNNLGTLQTFMRHPTVVGFAHTQPPDVLDAVNIPKYVTSLIIPPAMPRTTVLTGPDNQEIDYYEIAVRQFQQQILPPSLPVTTVWSYGSVNHAGTFNYPAFTIEALRNRPVRVKWINDLVDAQGNYLPHLLPVDPTLHWANPPGGATGRDSRPTFTETPSPYTGPTPIVTHVHGAHTTDDSDGYAEAWFLPAAQNIPADYATTGRWYNFFKQKFAKTWQVQWEPGSATSQYPNDMFPCTLWYHDHTLGMTRLNVYAGPAGFYLLRNDTDDVEKDLPGPAPARDDPADKKYYEIPIAIQDRAFREDGSLFYPDSRAFFDQFAGPYIPESDISPIWNPEFFGNTMVVNGRTWPNLDVEPRRYRFRFLNGCNSRFVDLKLVTGDPTQRPGVAALPFHQIGAEGGLLPKSVKRDHMLMAPAERADVIVDFTKMAPGTEVYLINEGPDAPFQGGTDYVVADPATTGQVMRFTVVPRTDDDLSLPPDALVLPTPTDLNPEIRTRRISISEMGSSTLPDVGPTTAMLGLFYTNDQPWPVMWKDGVTENPNPGNTEVWEIYNYTVDAHPIHLHQVMFRVVNRQPITGEARPPEAWETGRKDTVVAYPGEITRLKAQFDLAGQYVWHCHIVEHEDNEMMRPYAVGPLQYPDLDPNTGTIDLNPKVYLPLVTK